MCTLADTFAHASVLVDSSKDYTFSGEGKLPGEGTTLTKNGSGTLTINTANDYTGGTIINGGSLVLGHDSALGHGNVTLGTNCTLNLNNHTISNSVTLLGDANIGNGKFNGSISVGEEKNLALIGDLSGTGGITLADSATLDLYKFALSMDVFLTGDAQISDGTINGTDSVAAGKCLRLANELDGAGCINLADNSALDLLYYGTLSLLALAALSSRRRRK